MMALSTAVSSGTAPNGDAENSYNTFDVKRIDDDRQQSAVTKQSSLGSKDAQIYGQLIRDQLETLSKSRDSTPFITMLAKTLNPPNSAYVDETKLFIIIRTFTRELENLDNKAATPIILSLIEFEKWSQVSTKVTESYIQFFNVLISGNPKWWVEIARAAISQFPETSLDLTPHHSVVQRIIQIVPTSSAAFINIFASLFPHKSSSTAEITSYVKNLLKVVEYCPEQLHAVWELIIQRLVELDVECEDPEAALRRRSMEMEMQSQSQSQSESDSYDSDMDSNSEVSSDDESDDDNNSDFESGSSSDDYSDDDEVVPVKSNKTTASASKRQHSDDSEVNYGNKRVCVENIADGEEVTAVELDLASSLQQEPIAVKVDALLSLLLQHLSPKFSTNAVVSGEATPLFSTLLRVFRDIVLPTSRPQAVQFVWFFITHAHRDLLASFLSVLLETAMSSNASYDIRSRAMQYVASFVARAKGLSRPQIIFVVKFLADWVQRFVKERESEVDESISMARFKMFYSVVQTLFYIFVFRYSLLRIESDDHNNGQWEAGLDKLFQQAVNTKFNPLQYCQPEIVAMFARIAQNEEVASCYSIIERNRWGRFRSSKSEESNSARRISASNGLFDNNRDYKLYDSFLPYQPLRLRKSKHFFTDIYEKWSEHDVTDSDTDRERELEREEEEEEEEEDAFDDDDSLSD